MKERFFIARATPGDEEFNTLVIAQSLVVYTDLKPEEVEDEEDAFTLTSTSAAFPYEATARI